MTLEEAREQMKPVLNKRAKVIAKDHPHYDEICRTLDVDIVMGKPALRCKGDNQEFYVFSGKDLKFID